MIIQKQYRVGYSFIKGADFPSTCDHTHPSLIFNSSSTFSFLSSYPDLELIPPSGSSNISLLITLFTLLLDLHLSSGLPVESLQSLGQNGVREVVGGEQPVSIHGAKVLDLELDQGASELGVVAKLVGELIGLELELAAENVHAELDKGIGRAKDVREEKESNDDRVHRVEAKVGIKRVVVDENGEEGENGEEVGLVIVSNISWQTEETATKEQ